MSRIRSKGRDDAIQPRVVETQIQPWFLAGSRSPQPYIECWAVPEIWSTGLVHLWGPKTLHKEKWIKVYPNILDMFIDRIPHSLTAVFPWSLTELHAQPSLWRAHDPLRVSILSGWPTNYSQNLFLKFPGSWIFKLFLNFLWFFLLFGL